MNASAAASSASVSGSTAGRICAPISSRKCASALCAVLTVAVFGGRPLWVFALVMAWGFAVVADSAQFSALVTEYAPADQVGTALTFQTSLGFLLTMVTIDALPRVAAVWGWQYASLLLVPGPVAGALAMRRLVAPTCDMFEIPGLAIGYRGPGAKGSRMASHSHCGDGWPRGGVVLGSTFARAS